MVLRSQSVGEQDVADQLGAFCILRLDASNIFDFGPRRFAPGPILSRSYLPFCFLLSYKKQTKQSLNKSQQTLEFSF